LFNPSELLGNSLRDVAVDLTFSTDPTWSGAS